MIVLSSSPGVQFPFHRDFSLGFFNPVITAPSFARPTSTDFQFLRFFFSDRSEAFAPMTPLNATRISAAELIFTTFHLTLPPIRRYLFVVPISHGFLRCVSSTARSLSSALLGRWWPSHCYDPYIIRRDFSSCSLICSSVVELSAIEQPQPIPRALLMKCLSGINANSPITRPQRALLSSINRAGHGGSTQPSFSNINSATGHNSHRQHSPQWLQG